MKLLRNLTPIVMALCVVAILFAVGLNPAGGQSTRPGQKLALQAPPLISSVSAQANPEIFEIGEKLDDEAGIAAYYDAKTTANLESAKSVFRTIELETDDYILGSVGVPNYPEHFDAHVYVHKDGWLLAYYFNSEPASKIIDVAAHTISTTKLTSVLSIVASAAGVPFTGESYYDFRYPNATHILYVAEDDANGYDFTITIPSNYGYFERGWAVHAGTFILDGTDISGSATWGDGSTAYGVLTASQLLQDTPHTFYLYYSVYGVLMITYREQP